jgi:hypothetical protein
VFIFAIVVGIQVCVAAWWILHATGEQNRFVRLGADPVTEISTPSVSRATGRLRSVMAAICNRLIVAVARKPLSRGRERGGAQSAASEAQA